MVINSQYGDASYLKYNNKQQSLPEITVGYTPVNQLQPGSPDTNACYLKEGEIKDRSCIVKLNIS